METLQFALLQATLAWQMFLTGIADGPVTTASCVYEYNAGTCGYSTGD